MNILHITTFLQGGAGRIIAELACSQALSGHKVAVAASGNGEIDYGNYPEWLDRLSQAGIRRVLVESTFKRDVSLNIAAFRQIAESLDYASLSLIHAHAAIPSLVALLLRSKARRTIPILQTMHGWGIRKDPEQEVTDITLMNQLDRVVTTSNSSRQLLIRLGLAPELIEVVPNGVPAVSPLSDDGGADLLKQWQARGLRILVCLGTVGKRKNQRLLIEALAHAQAPHNLACAIVGEGDEAQALAALALESGIRDRVHFFGYQTQGARFLACADWLVLPSRDEGLPISVLEAHSAGVPVVGSNIPEIAEIIEHKATGLLFQNDNVDSLVRVLATAAGMPESKRLRMGAASKKRWEKQYSLEQMLARYDRIYHELL
jgi:L-malate glycosyltransferase